jgi:hypothetical protein
MGDSELRVRDLFVWISLTQLPYAHEQFIRVRQA